MKLLVTSLGALALSVSLFGVSDAFPPAKGGRQVVRGHDLLPRDKMSRLRDGKHHVHTTRSGHKVHVHTRGRKVSGMHAVDSKGRQHTMRAKVVRHAAGKGRPVSLHGGALTDTELALLQEGDFLTPGDGTEFVSTVAQFQILVVFSFQDPFTGQTLLFVWPVQSVSPAVLPPNLNPNGGIPGGDDLGDLGDLGI